MDDNLPWMLIQEKAQLYGKTSAFVWTDRRQHLLIFEYQTNKSATLSSTSSTLSVSDISSISSTRSTQIVDMLTISKCNDWILRLILIFE